MDDDTCRLFERVAQKMGWADEAGLDRAEKKLLKTIGKTRHAATSGHRSADRSDLPAHIALSDGEDPEKENRNLKSNVYRNNPSTDSSDDDFDQCVQWDKDQMIESGDLLPTKAVLVCQATPKAKPTPCIAAKGDSSNIVVVSSDDDDGSFEKFLQRVKTPNTKPKDRSESGSEDSLKNFIVEDYSSGDDFVNTKSSFKVPTKSNTPASRHLRRPLSQCDSPVFVSDSDDDDNIVIKSTWRTRSSKHPPKANVNRAVLSDKEQSLPSVPLSSPFSLPRKTSLVTPQRTLSAPSRMDDSASSEEEFTSLLERLKLKNKLAGTTFSPQNMQRGSKVLPVSLSPAKGFTKPPSKSLGEPCLHMQTPGKSTILKPTVSQTEPRHNPQSRLGLCKTPGCFLQSLSIPGSNYSLSFKNKKEELTSKLYQLYNTSVFDSKLPVGMSVTWNKKMRKTAGYCITGQERSGGSRYARIELSEKVCDSADRLRDTLIHEMCHAATWLINGVRDGHGSFWKLYARKATVAHPELPTVTRCHSYDIKYKFQYQCTRCQNTIGRHSKSLDTQRFVCALCTGQLVLLTPSKPRAATPFANFVKENYGTVRQELAGRSHADVMRKLSADFASKAKIQT